MEVARKVGDAVEKAFRTGNHVGIVVGVLLEDEHRIFAFGRISGTLKEPPPGDAVFEIGSVTKVFTASLLAQMAADGLVSLEDPVRKHLPDGVKVASRNGKIIRLLHLATHTSGLPRLPGNLIPRDDANPYGDLVGRSTE